MRGGSSPADEPGGRRTRQRSGAPAVNPLFTLARHDPSMPQATVGLRPPAKTTSTGGRSARIAWTVQQTARAK